MAHREAAAGPADLVAELGHGAGSFVGDWLGAEALAEQILAVLAHDDQAADIVLEAWNVLDRPLFDR